MVDVGEPPVESRAHCGDLQDASLHFSFLTPFAAYISLSDTTYAERVSSKGSLFYTSLA